jgi:hypothetical protein
MILIQCTKSKRDEPAKAKNLYDESDYFCKMRAYAEATDTMWFILSAKHGLLDPNTTVEPYDEFGLSEKQAEEIATEIANGPDQYVEICAGSEYKDPLIPELETRGIDVLELCRGMKIGARKQHLQQKTDRMMHDTL